MCEIIFYKKQLFTHAVEQLLISNFNGEIFCKKTYSSNPIGIVISKTAYAILNHNSGGKYFINGHFRRTENSLSEYSCVYR